MARAKAKVRDELLNLRFIAEEQDKELAALKENQKVKFARLRTQASKKCEL